MEGGIEGGEEGGRGYDLGVWVPLNSSTCLRAPTVVGSPVHEASTQHCGMFLPGIKLSASTLLTCPCEESSQP